MTDQKMPQRIELLNVGKRAKILVGVMHGHVGKITDFNGSEYIVDVEIHDPDKPAIPTVVSGGYKPSAIYIENGDSHIVSLTSAGVAGELAKAEPKRIDLPAIRARAEGWKVPAGVSEQAKEDLLILLGLIDQLKSDNETLTNRLTAAEVAAKKVDDLYRDLQAAQQARDSHLAANTKLNQEKVTLQERIAFLEDHSRDLAAKWTTATEQLEEAKKHRNTDIEALKLVERDRDDAREELRKSEKIVQMFAKRLRAKKAQPVEVKTLVQTLLDDPEGEKHKYENDVLADLLNDGWTVLNMSVTTASDIANHEIAITRVVTLSRPIKRTSPAPKPETAVENPIPVGAQTIFAAGVHIPAGTSYSAPLNLKSFEERQREGDEKCLDEFFDAINLYRANQSVQSSRPFPLQITGGQS